MQEERVALLPSDRQHKNLMFDFYGGLLTDKQRDCFTLHYMDDLSLAEIGGQSGITPQAVADLLKRSCALLQKYEDKLALVKKLTHQRKHVKSINEHLTAISQVAKASGLDGIVDLADSIRASVNELI